MKTLKFELLFYGALSGALVSDYIKQLESEYETLYSPTKQEERRIESQEEIKEKCTNKGNDAEELYKCIDARITTLEQENEYDERNVERYKSMLYFGLAGGVASLMLGSYIGRIK